MGLFLPVLHLIEQAKLNDYPQGLDCQVSTGLRKKPSQNYFFARLIAQILEHELQPQVTF